MGRKIFKQTSLCMLDEILRRFPGWQISVFMTVYDSFGFEICQFKQ